VVAINGVVALALDRHYVMVWGRQRYAGLVAGYVMVAINNVVALAWGRP